VGFAAAGLYSVFKEVGRLHCQHQLYGSNLTTDGIAPPLTSIGVPTQRPLLESNQTPYENGSHIDKSSVSFFIHKCSP